MPIYRSRWPLGRLLLAIAAVSALTLIASSTPAGAAKTTSVHLRVVTSAGRTLAEEAERTGTTEIKTRKHADCFGKGTGGSGDRVKVHRATALGVLADVAEKVDALNPLLITDAFVDDGFGLGVCAVGGVNPPATGYWYAEAKPRRRDRLGQPS